jgi:drug/metabolite transporter (DMT)-like permease
MSTFVQIIGYLAVVAGALLLVAAFAETSLSPALGIGTTLAGAFLCVFGRLADDVRIIREVLIDRDKRF